MITMFKLTDMYIDMKPSYRYTNILGDYTYMITITLYDLLGRELTSITIPDENFLKMFDIFLATYDNKRYDPTLDYLLYNLFDMTREEAIDSEVFVFIEDYMSMYDNKTIVIYNENALVNDVFGLSIYNENIIYSFTITGLDNILKFLNIVKGIIQMFYEPHFIDHWYRNLV